LALLLLVGAAGCTVFPIIGTQLAPSIKYHGRKSKIMAKVPKIVKNVALYSFKYQKVDNILISNLYISIVCL
jgi:hypothetical protein